MTIPHVEHNHAAPLLSSTDQSNTASALKTNPATIRTTADNNAKSWVSR